MPASSDQSYRQLQSKGKQCIAAKVITANVGRHPDESYSHYQTMDFHNRKDRKTFFLLSRCSLIQLTFNHRQGLTSTNRRLVTGNIIDNWNF